MNRLLADNLICIKKLRSPSHTSIADETREERRRRVMGE